MAGLTDTAIRKAKAADKGYKLTDDGGLHLFVSPAGGKSWRYRYEFAGKEKLLTLGQYPVMGLADARAARDEAHNLVKAGRDPAVAKRHQQIVAAVQSGETFEVLGRDWHKVNLPRWSAIHGGDILESLERDVFPIIGALPIREVSVPLVLAVVRAVEARGSMETARRIRQRMEAVFDFAIAEGKAVDNPAMIVTGAMAPMQRGRHPAITELTAAREILQRVEAQSGHPLTKLAHRLLALTAVRPGIVINLPWAELPRGETVWTVPAARMPSSLISSTATALARSSAESESQAPRSALSAASSSFSRPSSSMRSSRSRSISPRRSSSSTSSKPSSSLSICSPIASSRASISATRPVGTSGAGGFSSRC